MGLSGMCPGRLRTGRMDKRREVRFGLPFHISINAIAVVTVEISTKLCLAQVFGCPGF